MLCITSYHYHPLVNNYLFQHDMSLTNEHGLFSYISYEHVDIIPKKINKGAYVNAKGENEEMLLYLICENNHDEVILILCMIFNLFCFCFINHKLYEFGNDPMKIICVENKTRMKVDRRNKILKLFRIVFFLRRL